MRTNEGWVLIRVGQVEDWDKAVAAYEDSKLPIDAEHREVMEATLEGPFRAELIYECSL